MGVLESALASGEKLLDGETVFRLYDTFGFPVDLTADICRERGVTIDMAGFEAAMEQQRERARAASQVLDGRGPRVLGRQDRVPRLREARASGARSSRSIAKAPVQSLKSGETGIVVLDETPFYAESGGQVGDRGELVGSGGTFAVDDTQKIQADVFGHHGTLKTGALKVGDRVEARVDTALRARTMRNHSVTHLMHKALREVLGPHVQQKGSLVDADKTRFDFSHNKPMTERARSARSRRCVNAEILQNTPTRAQVMPIERGEEVRRGDAVRREVRRRGARARHRLARASSAAARTSRAPATSACSRSSPKAAWPRASAASRRPPALTALALVNSAAAGVPRGRAPGARAARRRHGREGGQRSCSRRRRALEKELAALKLEARSPGRATISRRRRSRSREGRPEARAGRDAGRRRRQDAARDLDQLKDKLKSAAIVLGAVNDGKVSLIAGVTADLTAQGEGGRAGELRRAAGRRQGRRPAGHGAGGRHRPRGTARRAAVGASPGSSSRRLSLLEADLALRGSQRARPGCRQA